MKGGFFKGGKKVGDHISSKIEGVYHLLFWQFIEEAVELLILNLKPAKLGMDKIKFLWKSWLTRLKVNL